MLKTIYLYLGQHKSLVSLLLSRENIFLYSLIKQLYFDIQSWRQGAPDRALAERELGMRKMGPGSCVVEGDFPSSPGAAEMSPLVYSEEIDQ